MDQSDLKKLSRLDLIELLLEQTKRAEELERELADACTQLEDREIALERAGSIAQAALEINKVFEAADAAAEQYKQNVKELFHKKAEEQFRQWKDKMESQLNISEDTGGEQAQGGRHVSPGLTTSEEGAEREQLQVGKGDAQ